jgi:hypothetical protein
MTDAAWKLIGLGLAIALLLALGTGGGAWLASGHYRPLLDTVETDLASAKTINGNLLALTTEQGLALGGLVQAGEKRQEAAKVAVATAKEEAKPDYAAANTIQQGHTGGDPATAAASIIDQELGL